MEKMGLVNEAAEFYYQSLQRKPTNVDARIKLKEVGQKYVSNLSSEFFRNLNTNQTESTLQSYERLKDFTDRTALLSVTLDYPKTYEEDYRKTVETYCSRNYHQAYLLVNQKKYNEALPYISKVNRYNKAYKNIAQLYIIATCEPLYQSAVNNLENKNYSSAVQALSGISQKTEDYKDYRELLQMATAQNTKNFILFEPKSSGALARSIEEVLYNNFNQASADKLSNVKVINNTPFQQTRETFDFTKSANIDLIQAIRKATGADYFYFFSVANAKEFDSGLSRSKKTGYQETRTRKNDTLVLVEYTPFNYTAVKGSRNISFDFTYRIVNAHTSQMTASQTKLMQSGDEVEYQEFQNAFKGNINSLYPYNPKQTAPTAQFNPKSWRNQFSARNTLKSFEDLRKDVYDQSDRFFMNSATVMK